MSTSNPQSPRAAAAIVEKQKRRANSCIPCRESKSRCTGGIPCTTCMKKRIKPRCIYRIVELKEEEPDELAESSLSEQDDADPPATTYHQDARVKEDLESSDDDSLVILQESFFGPFSLSRTVDEYKLSSSVEGPLHDILDSIQTTKAFVVDTVEGRATTTSRSSLTQSVPARDFDKSLLTPDLDTQLPRHILRLHYKYLAVCHLLNTGKVTQAWTTFPSLARDAELFGLGQDLPSKEETLEEEIVEAHRRIWWLLVALDIRLSVLLGRPPYLPRTLYQIPVPSFNLLPAEKRELQQSSLEFTQYKMEVLTLVYADKVQAHSGMADRKSRYEALWKKFEKIQKEAPAPSQDGSKDIAHSVAIAKHQLDIHLFSIVFHHHLTRVATTEQSQATRRERQTTAQAKASRSRNLRKQPPSKYHKEMQQSARRVLELFNHIYASVPSRSELQWTQYFGVYCAALILGTARIRQESEVSTDLSRIEQILKVFQDIMTDIPEVPIARLAIASLESVVRALRDIEDRRGPGQQISHEPTMQAPFLPARNEEPAASSRPKVKRDVAPINTITRKASKRGHPSIHEEDSHIDKRARQSAPNPTFDASGHQAAWPNSQEQQYVQHVPTYGDVSMGSFNDSQSFPPSATTSFTGNEPMDFGGLEYAPTQDNSHHYNSAGSWYHPPMQIHPPMYDSHWQAQGAAFTILGGNGAQHSFYGEPGGMSMNDHQQLDQQMQSQHSIIMNDMRHGNSTRPDDGSLQDPTAARVSAANLLTSENHAAQQDTGFYNTVGDSYGHAEHPASSPILGHGLAQPETMFAHPAGGSRRHSMADIGQQQIGGWPVDVPPSFNEARYPGKVKSATKKARSPPLESIISPLSEVGPQSRRNSATPMQIAQHGVSMNVPHPPDFSLDGSVHPPMIVHPPMMIPLQVVHGKEYHPGSRRQSLAHISDVSSQPTPMSEASAEHYTVRQGWQGRPGPPTNQLHYDGVGTMGYDLAEMNNSGMAFNTQFHHSHHQHHPHHGFAAPAQPTATTGPYAAGWWRAA